MRDSEPGPTGDAGMRAALEEAHRDRWAYLEPGPEPLPQPELEAVPVGVEELPRGARMLVNAAEVLELATRAVGPWPVGRDGYRMAESFGVRVRGFGGSVVAGLWVAKPGGDGHALAFTLAHGAGVVGSVDARKLLRGELVARGGELVEPG